MTASCALLSLSPLLAFFSTDGDALLEALEVGEHQLGLDRLGVGQRIDAVLDVRDVVVLEAAQHVGDGVDLADVRQELVAEAFALGGAAHQARDVDEGEPRRDDLARLGDRRELVEPLIGHADLADVGLDGAEWIVGGLGRRRLRQRVEERRLADVRQAHDAAFEAHVAVRAGWRGWATQAGAVRARALSGSVPIVKPGVAAGSPHLLAGD